jgi:hypothetical protein
MTFSEDRTVFYPTWKIQKHQTTDDRIIGRMRISCWTTKATDTHLEYAISIGVTRQQWLSEGASILLLYVYGLSS